MSARPPERRAEPPAVCGIAAHALVSARFSEIAALRDRPGPAGSPALPPRFLRHCDEHTVVGMHAVLAALADLGAPPADVARHAVVAASCQAGRLAAARTLAGLAAGGGVSVSTHIVPQCSLHSVAGAVSVGLGMHGPHVGVGGGPDALAEGLFAAATLVHAPAMAGDPPCVWLVATDWEEEPALDASGQPTGDPVCRGLALAIEAGTADTTTDGGRSAATRGLVAAARRASAATISSLSLTLRFAEPPRPRPRPAEAAAAGGLAAFARALEMCREGTALVSWVIECPWGAEIRVSRCGPAVAHRVLAARLREAA